MADEPLIDRLDRTIEDVLGRRDASAALSDPELAPLAVIAAQLRHAPSPAFRARLLAQLTKRKTMTTLVLEPTKIREGFTTVTPYVRMREAGLLDFLTAVFDAKETFNLRGSAGGVHREVRVGDSMLMIGEGGVEGTLPFAPAAFHVYVPDVDAAFQRAIAAGASSLGDPADRPYGERAAFVTDPFGNLWFIATRHGENYVGVGLKHVTPSLLPLKAAPVLEFMKNAFGARVEGVHEQGGKLMHAFVHVGEAVLEIGEAGEKIPPFAFYMHTDDVDGLYERAVKAGGISVLPPGDQAYGDRLAIVQDPGGNRWFVAKTRES